MFNLITSGMVFYCAGLPIENTGLTPRPLRCLLGQDNLLSKQISPSRGLMSNRDLSEELDKIHSILIPHSLIFVTETKNSTDGIGLHWPSCSQLKFTYTTLYLGVL